MLLGKKKQELSDQHEVNIEREAPRFELKAGISIDGYEGEGLLGNVSVSGCYLGSVTYVALKPGEVYQAKIIPDAGDNIEPFSLTLRLSWTRSSETLFHAGFSLEKNQSNTFLKRYVELLQKRGVKPDYGKKKHGRR